MEKNTNENVCDGCQDQADCGIAQAKVASMAVEKPRATLNVETAVMVQGADVVDLGDLLMVAEGLSMAEGRNLYKHTVKMSVAAGDLAACLSESKGDFPMRDEVADEVAALIIRAAIFGSAFGMNASTLRDAMRRTSAELLNKAIDDRFSGQLKQMGLKTGFHARG